MDDVDSALYQENGRLNDPLGGYIPPKTGFKPKPVKNVKVEPDGHVHVWKTKGTLVGYEEEFVWWAVCEICGEKDI